MLKKINTGSMIKRYIDLRGLTVKEVAEKFDKNEKTLYSILEEDRLSAKLLFDLALYLNIDLNWLAELSAQRDNISLTQLHQVTRMSEEFRLSERKNVLLSLDNCIKSCGDSISEVRTELKKIYPQTFYLLDVLIPEDYQIIVTVERNRERYLCLEPQNETRTRGRRATPTVRNEKEMLNIIIAQRMEELK